MSRRDVLALLERDAEHDGAGGDPEAAPVRLADYRRAVCALVGLRPLPVLEPGRWVAGEGRAWLAGHHAWRESLVGAVAAVWREAAGRRRACARMSRRRLLSWSADTACPAGVRSDREYVRAMLVWDVAYDEDPEGDPPLLTYDYRAGLVAVMRLEPVPLVTAGPWVTDKEKTAYDAGQHAAYDQTAMTVWQTWQSPAAADSGRTQPGSAAGFVGRRSS
jgi:hypothetical protein